MSEIRRYVTRTGKDVFGHWLTGLKDLRARAKIAVRIDRIAAGNFGDCKALRQGVFELRVDWGPGYRVYFAKVEREIVLLLCAGDKGEQSSDIIRALGYLQDYRERTNAHETKSQHLSR